MVARKKKSGATVATAKDYAILLSPVVTEKSAKIGQGGNTVVFRVDREATKSEIKIAIQRIFNKEVDSVRVANFVGKPKRRGASSGRTPQYKKAFITLKGDASIDIVEGV